MKTLLLVVPLLLLAGCESDPMSEAEAKAYAACLAQGWVPTFKATSTVRTMECERK